MWNNLASDSKTLNDMNQVYLPSIFRMRRNSYTTLSLEVDPCETDNFNHIYPIVHSNVSAPKFTIHDDVKNSPSDVTDSFSPTCTVPCTIDNAACSQFVETSVTPTTNSSSGVTDMYTSDDFQDDLHPCFTDEYDCEQKTSGLGAFLSLSMFY